MAPRMTGRSGVRSREPPPVCGCPVIPSATLPWAARKTRPMATLCPTACVPPKPVTGNACGGGAVGAAATTEAVVAVGTAVAGTVVAVGLGLGVLVGTAGTGVSVGGTGVLVGGTGVSCRYRGVGWRDRCVGRWHRGIGRQWWLVAGTGVLVGGTGVEVGGTGVLTVKTGMIGCECSAGCPDQDDHGGGLRGATGRRGDGGGVEHRFRTNAHLDPNVEGDGHSDTNRTGIQGDRIEHGIVGAPGVRDAAKEGLTRSRGSLAVMVAVEPLMLVMVTM